MAKASTHQGMSVFDLRVHNPEVVGSNPTPHFSDLARLMRPRVSRAFCWRLVKRLSKCGVDAHARVCVPRWWNTPGMARHSENLLDVIQRDALDGDVLRLAGTLRKLVALGGQAGSGELRDWASQELRGYEGSGSNLPAYRKPGAVLQINGFSGPHQITGQQISPRMLPDGVRGHLGEEVPLGQSIGEIEALLDRAREEDGYVKLTVPGSQDVAALMNHENKGPFQHISAVYWSLGAPALSGVLDRVRTTLVEPVAEMKAGMPSDSSTPAGDLADQAVNVVVHGRGARINVTAARASEDAHQEISGTDADSASGGRWGRVAVAATVIGVLIALAQWQGWGI